MFPQIQDVTPDVQYSYRVDQPNDTVDIKNIPQIPWVDPLQKCREELEQRGHRILILEHLLRECLDREKSRNNRGVNADDVEQEAADGLLELENVNTFEVGNDPGWNGTAMNKSFRFKEEVVIETTSISQGERLRNRNVEADSVDYEIIGLSNLDFIEDEILGIEKQYDTWISKGNSDDIYDYIFQYPVNYHIITDQSKTLNYVFVSTDESKIECVKEEWINLLRDCMACLIGSYTQTDSIDSTDTFPYDKVVPYSRLDNNNQLSIREYYKELNGLNIDICTRVNVTLEFNYRDTDDIEGVALYSSKVYNLDEKIIKDEISINRLVRGIISDLRKSLNDIDKANLTDVDGEANDYKNNIKLRTSLRRVHVRSWNHKTKYQVEGGCMGNYSQQLQRIKGIYCPKNEGSNYGCFYHCLVYWNMLVSNNYLGLNIDNFELTKNPEIDGTFNKYIEDIKTRNIEIKKYTSYIDIYNIAVLLNIRITISIFNERNFGYLEIIEDYNKHLPVLMEIGIYRNHYFLITERNKLKALLYCQACKRMYVNGVQHLRKCRGLCVKCKNRIDTRGNHICKGGQAVNGVRDKDNMEVDSKPIRKYENDGSFNGFQDIIFADFETFPAEDGLMIPYSASWGYFNNYMDENTPEEQLYQNVRQMIIKNHIGHDCVDVFLNDCLLRGGTIVFFNGSAFDNLFCLNWFIRNGFRLKNDSLLKKDNKILNMSIKRDKIRKTKALNFFDLYLFVHSSLSRACIDYKLPEDLRKKEFDHDLIKTWGDIEVHKQLIAEYNNYDIYSLACIYAKCAIGFWKTDSVNMKKYITLSQMCYKIWTCDLTDKDIFIPNRKQHDWFRKALYGGRSMPQWSDWKSTHYDNLHRIYNNHGSIDKHIGDGLEDYMDYMDVVSLYPYAAYSFKYPYGTIKDIISEDQEFQYIKNLLEQHIDPHTARDQDLRIFLETACQYFIEVDVESPRNLTSTILLSRDSRGHVEHKLNKKLNQVYFLPELLLCTYLLGYKVENIHRLVKFEKCGKLFESFMKRNFELKKNSEKGSVPYNQAKLKMNSLTGKLNQGLIDDNWLCFPSGNITITEVEDDFELTDFDFLTEGHDEVIGIMLKINKEALPEKPGYLGTAILSYARIHMTLIDIELWGDGYRDISNSYVYRDTDSSNIHNDVLHYTKQCYPEVSKRLFGNNLGQLTSELEGGKEIFYCALAPKTYIIEYIKEKNGIYDIYYKVRCKGIPHTGNAFTIREVTRSSEPLLDSKIYYKITSPEGEILYTNKLISEDFLNVLKNNYSIICCFSMMMKKWGSKYKTNQFSNIYVIETERNLSKTKWWGDIHETGKKRYLMENGFSLPFGHEDIFTFEYPALNDLINLMETT